MRAYLLSVIVIATVPLAGLMCWMIIEEGQVSRGQFEVGLERSAASFALTVEREVASSVDALTILSYSSFVRGNDVSGFFAALVELPRRLPSWNAAYLLDPEGKVMFSTGAPHTPGAEPGQSSGAGSSVAATLVADPQGRAAFEEVSRTLKPAVSNLVPGGVGGSATIGVLVPVIVNERLRYVLGATIDSAHWRKLLVSASLPADTRVLLVDGSGRVIASNAHLGRPDAEAGRSAAQPVQISAAARKAMTSAAPGVERGPVFGDAVSYTSWQHVAGTQWTVGMDVPAAPIDRAAYVALRTAALAALLSLLTGVILAIVLARKFTQPLRQLAREGPEAVTGNLPVREIVVLREALRSADAAHRLASERLEADMADRKALAEREQMAREEAEAANRVKDEFMAMLGHELRNPLGAISSAAELLKRLKLAEPPAQSAVRIIVRQTAHLAGLMEDLLDVSRVISGKIMLSRTPLNLASLVKRVMSTLEMAGAARDHRVSVQTVDVWVHADLTRIEQVVGNLVTNALKYTPGGGQVAVTVKAKSGWAVLEVRDNGVGIAPALLPRLFDLFVQGDRALDRRQGGLGVGLTLVHRLVELHGGTVQAESPGVGSVFTVRLRAIDPPDVESSRKQLPGDAFCDAARKRRVLVIEDNEDALQMVRALIELSGHEVLSASDGTSGLQMLVEQSVDVALVDIGLPGLDGLEVAQRARAAGVSCLIVALTGYGQPKDVERTRAAGFDAHLVKPIDPGKLQAMLDGP